MSNPNIVTTAIRRIKSSWVRVDMPLCAKQYTCHMSGVDPFDSWRSKKYGQIFRTSKKNLEMPTLVHGK